MRVFTLLFFILFSGLLRADLQSNYSACASKVGEFSTFHSCNHIFTNKDFTLGADLYSCLQETYIDANYLEAHTTTKFSSSPKPVDFPLSEYGQIFLNWQTDNQYTYQGLYAEAYCKAVSPPTVFDAACRYKLKTCDASASFPSRYCESLTYTEELFEEGCEDKRECVNGSIGVQSSTNLNNAPYCSCTSEMHVVDGGLWYTNCECRYQDSECSQICESFPCDSTPPVDEGGNGDNGNGDNGNGDDGDGDTGTGTGTDTGADCKQSDSKISGAVKFCPDDWRITYKEFRILRCGALEGNCEGKDSDAIICYYLGNGCNGGSYVVAPDELTNGFVVKQPEAWVTLNRFFKPAGSNIPILDRCEADQYCTNPLSKASSAEVKECDYETAKPTLDLPCPVTTPGTELDPTKVVDTSICQNGCQYVKSGYASGGAIAGLCTFKLNPVSSSTSSCASGSVSGFPCGIDGTPPCNVRDTVTHALLGDVKTLIEALTDEVDHSLAITLSTTAIVGAIAAAGIANAEVTAVQTTAIGAGLGAQTVAIEAGLAAQTVALVAAIRAQNIADLFKDSKFDIKPAVDAIEHFEKTYKDSIKPADFKPNTEIENEKLDMSKISTTVDVSNLIKIPDFTTGTCPLHEKVEIPIFTGSIEIDFSYACTVLLILKILFYVTTLLAVQAIIFK